MYSLDIKVTVWERINIETAEELNDVLTKLRNGELESGCDVADYLDRSSRYIDETSEEMRVEDNLGLATMELLDEDGNSIWKNSEDMPSKFICGVCGENVDTYTHNEEKDVDECNDCKA